MGLDVYLYKCPDRAIADETEKRYDEESEAIWGEYGEYKQMAEEQKDEARKRDNALREQMGLVKYGLHPTREEIEMDSKLYPDHLFKLGYFRSSYNEGGINNVMRRLGLLDLYAVFEPGDEYYVVPDWAAALAKAQEAIDALVAWKSKNGEYDVMVASHNPLIGLGELPASEPAALNDFLDEIDKEYAHGCYSSRKGSFFLVDKALEVVALIPGTRQGWAGQELVTYVVYRTSGEKLDWYLHALEIVKETIEYVLEQPDVEQYYLVWSS